ncbi:hypothetical protein BO83DRAFT_431367 [Aspergillus eucalypticola CBS 122712]|uniref:Zn(2)-C6 fungal-type domain-containing protein n=1 Tax=Aspergillus eucalypticola (strain CBS 122712 / IBT 29274) TaxID=1448314 RepID=A0A317UTW9_ASPEC|nr:uncharacterized protein BO83DRAFT_431367 [Aspergillus eucalypticola CBS 122712]PWY63977.1 hypothetical protein BO83DRAFT_431367 [Aspergillus eucalypticola CBS 122712]
MSTPQLFGRACKTCRRRGRRCDRVLPACGTCESNGLVCEGYLLRWSGLASRGRLAGKTFPMNAASSEKRQIRPRRSQQQAPPAASTTRSPTGEERYVQDRQPYDEATPSNGSSEWLPAERSHLNTDTGSPIDSASFTVQPEVLDDTFLPSDEAEIAPEVIAPCDARLESGQIPTSQPPLFPALDIIAIPTELKFILEYHLCEVVPKLCVDNHDPKNPYRDYIFPLATEVPSLMYACAALAACHFNVRLGTTQFQNEFLRFKGKAMKRLQEDLYSPVRAKQPATIATILMLCLCDICHRGFSTFDSHFRGAKKLIELRGSDRTVGCFVEQYLVWLDIMAAASHSRQPVFSRQDIGEFFDGSGPDWSFDVFPCTLDQFQVLCEIVSVYKSQTNPERPSMEVLCQVEEIKQKLLQGWPRSNRGTHWFHLTEAYRYAILLYLIRLFPCDVDEYEIDWLVSSVFYHARSTPPASGWSDQLLWPLFHAGLETKDSKRQNWLRERAQCMQISGGFGNVQSALTILEGVWAGQRPSKYLDLMQGFENVNLLLI